MRFKVKGFNEKEQKIFNVLLDKNPHTIRELKMLFTKEAKDRCKLVYSRGWGDVEIDLQARSYVRNSIRRIRRDGWIKAEWGTYQLSAQGKKWVKEGRTVTRSCKEKGKPGRPRKKKLPLTKAKVKKAKAKKKTNNKPKVKKVSRKKGNHKPKMTAAKRKVMEELKKRAQAVSLRAKEEQKLMLEERV